LAVALMGCAVALGDIRAVTPCENNPNPNEWWMKRHAEKMKLVKAGGSEVVFVGDSITHGWEGNGRTQWERYFGGEPYKALNLGFGGDRTEHVLWRIAHGEFDGYAAKVILLMIGTNNTGHNSFEKEPTIDTIIGIREVIRQLQAKQPQAKIVLTAILPRGRDNDDALRKRNETVNLAISTFADNRKVFWVDFNAALLRQDGVLPLNIMPDRLHPQAYGYEIWASAVLPYVNYALDCRNDGTDKPFPSTYRSNADYLNGPQDWGADVTTKPVFHLDDSVEPMDSPWLKRLVRNRREISESGGEFDLVLVGDSIMQGWEGAGKAVYADIKARYRTLNLGYDGDRTENVLWRLENGELEGYKAKLFMVMIGTNNIKTAPEHVAMGVKAVIAKIRTRHPEAKVLLLPIFPRGEKPQDVHRQRVAAVNGFLTGVADGKNVFENDFAKCYVGADGTISRSCLYDHLHPTEEGYRIWLKAVLPLVKSVCGR